MRTRPAIFVAAILVSGTASAHGVEVVFSNIASSPTSDVPGIPDLKFKPGASSAIAFDRPFRSPDGTLWAIKAFVDAADNADDVIVFGDGPSAVDAAVLLRAGEPTDFDPAVNYNAINTHLTINDDGRIAFSGTTSASTSQFIGLHDGSDVLRIARQGGDSVIPGKVYTAILNGAHVLADGTAGFQATATPAPTAHVVVLGSAAVVRDGKTVPSGQGGDTSFAIATLISNSLRVSNDGTRLAYVATLSDAPTASQRVLVVDNEVALQAGFPVDDWHNTALISSLASDAGSVQFSRNGQHWAVRGAVNDGVGAGNQTDFVVVDGSVVAETDAPIAPVAPERFDDSIFGQTFFVNTVNNHGDYVIGGVTDHSDIATNAVLVLNGTRVIAREGDPVDLDGNGTFDDDVFIDIFGNDDVVLTDDRHIYFVASLRDGDGQAVGNAYLHLDCSPVDEHGQPLCGEAPERIFANGFEYDGPPPPPVPGVITDGGASVNFQAGGITSNYLNGFAARLRFPSQNETFAVGWWLRTLGDATQLRQPLPVSTTYTGNTAVFTWTNVGALGVGAHLQVTIQDTSPGQDGSEGNTVWTLTLSNPTNADQTINLFAYADADIGATATNDSATLVAGNHWMRVTDAVAPTTVDFRGIGADAYRVASFPALRDALNSATPQTLDNSGLPFGPADFTGAVQWQDRILPANASATFTWELWVAQGPPP